MTKTQALTILNVEDGANAYSHPNHTGDVTSVGDGAQTIANDAVTDAKLRNSAALSIIGRSSNSVGDPADIAAVAASDAVHRESGSVIGFGTIATGGIADDAVTDAKLANMAANTIKGNNTGGAADPADLTAAQVRTLLNVADGATDDSYSAGGSVGVEWAVSVPTTIKGALDRIAAAVASGTSGPIA
jgi:hypothetical protein